MRSPRLLSLALIGFLCFGGCWSDRPAGAKEVQSVVVRPPQPTSGPYVSVAVDNHFHDIHPADHIEIAADRTFIVKNEGSNLHNVTISGTNINVDLKPGEQVRFAPIKKQMPPRLYTLICRIHGSMGMFGQFRVVAHQH
jgi:hypothetical protein